MARRYRQHDEEATIDLTPMLDIVFIMLIFFIVTTSFVKEAGIEVERPQAAQGQPLEQAPLLIAISAEGEVWLDQRRLDIERVAANVERLLAEQPTDSAVIQADRNARHGTVVRVMDQLKAAGIAHIAVAAAAD